MEEGRKRVHYCLTIVVLTAIVMGLVYYYGQRQGQTTVTEGTLITITNPGWIELWQ